MRYRYSHLQRLHPCQRTMENSVIGHNNGIWQTARFRQSHRNMRIVRSRSFQMIGNGGMRIEHKNLFPKLIAQGFNCANLIRVSSNEHEKMQGAFAFRVKPLRRIGRASRVVSNPSRGSTHIVSNPKSANKGYTEISR